MAYTLDANCSPEFRGWALGHSPNSTTYMRYYKPKTSTVDIQSIMHGAPERDVIQMSSMSLGRVKHAPMKISDAGRDKVMCAPEIREASRRCSDALDDLTSCEKYTTMEAASENCSQEYLVYKKASDTLKSRIRTLNEQEYKKEYDEYVRSNQTLGSPSPTQDTDVGQSFNPVYTEDINPMSVDDVDTDAIPIDPRLLDQGDFDRIVNGKVEDMFESMNLNPSTHNAEEEGNVYEYVQGLDGDAMDASESSERSVDSSPLASTSFTTPSSTTSVSVAQGRNRLHGLYRTQAAQRFAEGSYYETKVLRPHRFDTIYEDATTSPKSNLDLACLLIPFFKTMHPLERYGNLEPEPSTFVCPSCQEDQASKEHFDKHITGCRRDVALMFIEDDWKRHLDSRMVLPCNWVVNKDGKECEKTFGDHQKFTRHILQHSYRTAKKKCMFGSCSGLSNPPPLNTRDEWSDHLATAHGLTYYLPSTLVFFCCFCDEYVSYGIAGPSARIQHYDTHLKEAFDAVKKHGYNEVRSTSNGLELLTVRHPWFCIWCLHDSKLAAPDRIATCNEKTGHVYGRAEKDHLLRHFLDIKGLLTPCPASAAAGAEFPLCSSTNKFGALELEQHLQHEHGIHRATGLSTAGTKPKRVRVRGKAKAMADAERVKREKELHGNDLSENESEEELFLREQPAHKKNKTGIVKNKSINVL